MKPAFYRSIRVIQQHTVSEYIHALFSLLSLVQKGEVSREHTVLALARGGLSTVCALVNGSSERSTTTLHTR